MSEMITYSNFEELVGINEFNMGGQWIPKKKELERDASGERGFLKFQTNVQLISEMIFVRAKSAITIEWFMHT
jgi:hypothetical protein